MCVDLSILPNMTNIFWSQNLSRKEWKKIDKENNNVQCHLCTIALILMPKRIT
jgi:hypothetical protein